MSKTKPTSNITSFAFPSCGEFFQEIVQSLELHQWQDAWRKSPPKEKVTKPTSDQLRDWATEKTVPTLKDFEKFLMEHLNKVPPLDDEIKAVIVEIIMDLILFHIDFIHEMPCYGKRDSCCRIFTAPFIHRFLLDYFYLKELFLWKFQQKDAKNIILGTPIKELFEKLMLEKYSYPLTHVCVETYVSKHPANGINDKTLHDWESGNTRPLIFSIGRFFENDSNLIEIVMNFVFARCMENMKGLLFKGLPSGDKASVRKHILRYIGIFSILDASFKKKNEEAASFEDFKNNKKNILLSFNEEFERCECENGYLSGIPGMESGVSAFRELKKYFYNSVPVDQFKTSFVEFKTSFVEAEEWILTREKDNIVKALKYYMNAVEDKVYSLGPFTKLLFRAAIEFVCFAYRNNIGEDAQKTLRAWIEKSFARWDLLDLGDEYDHVQLDQRIEKATRLFTDNLPPVLMEKLEKKFRDLKLLPCILPPFGIVLRPRQIQKRLNPGRTAPMKENKTLCGQEQTVLIEALERRNYELAKKRIRNGEDLNFQNLSGVTAPLAAITAKFYDLAMEIISDKNNKLKADTLLRNTQNYGNNTVSEAINHGCVEILAAIAERFPNEINLSDKISMIKQEISFRSGPPEMITPLYNAILTYSFLKEPIKHFQKNFQKSNLTLRPDLINKFFELLKTNKLSFLPENSDGIVKCIDFLIQWHKDRKVTLDTPNLKGHSALTLAVECGLHEIVTKLLTAGADENHRTEEDGTCIQWALNNNDTKMLEILAKSSGAASLASFNK